MLELQIGRWLYRQDKDRSIYLCPSLPLILATDKGRARNENQDRVAAMRVHTGAPSNKSFICVAVCDGMGGMRDGGLGATVALSRFMTELVRLRRTPPIERLENAARYANKAVFNELKGKGGTTLSAILLEEQSLFSINIGDSRIYAEDNAAQQLTRMTVDDNLAEAFGGQGAELVQFVGMGEGISPHVNKIQDIPKTVVITSDGAHFFDEKVFSKAYLNAPNIADGVDRLLSLADWLGSPDNATVAALDFQEFSNTPISQEGGCVEFWSPFGPLTLLWANREMNEVSAGLPERKTEINQSDISSSSADASDNQKAATTRKKSTRKRATKKKQNSEKEDYGQLEIDVSIDREERD